MRPYRMGERGWGWRRRAEATETDSPAWLGRTGRRRGIRVEETAKSFPIGLGMNRVERREDAVRPAARLRFVATVPG